MQDKTSDQSWLSKRELRRFWQDQKFAVLLMLAAIPIAIIIGVAFAVVGILTFALGGAIIGLVLVMTLQNEIYHYVLAGLLAGYMVLSKGFAVIGFYPVYVSEIGIAAGMGTMVVLFFINRRKLSFKPLLNFEVAILSLFLISQIIATIPYLSEYGVTAIRDAMQYGYVIYTFCIAALMPKPAFEKLVSWYHNFFPIYVTWVPIFFVLARVDVLSNLRFPGASVPLLASKGTDLAFHLGAAGVYLLLRLDRYQKKEWSQPMIWYLWTVIGFGTILMTMFGRSNFLTVVAAMFIAFIIRPSNGWFPPVVVGTVGICILLVTGWYSTIEIDIGQTRKISVEQFVENVMSIVGESDSSSSNGYLEGTKEFRLNWWTDIIEYTFFGDYFYTGKGYGINLADSDGYQVNADGSLRSPHNGHMTILARSGVPGFMMWLIYMLTGVVFLLRKIFNARIPEKDRKYAIWFLAFNMAFYVSMSFDVLMESPMGAIWYWAVQGFMFLYFTSDLPRKNVEPKKIANT